MTSPRAPRPTCPPEPLEITEEEYRAAQKAHEDAAFALCEATEDNLTALSVLYEKAERNWQDAQRRAASDHQALWRDDPAYRREVRERDYLP